MNKCCRVDSNFIGNENHTFPKPAEEDIKNFIIVPIGLASQEREDFLLDHDFFVEHAKALVFDHLEKIDGDVIKNRQEYLARIIKIDFPHSVESQVAGIASQSLEHLLNGLRNRIGFSVLASLYFKWETDFRGHLEKRHSNRSTIMGEEKISKFCRSTPMVKFFDQKMSEGWVPNQEPWFKNILDLGLLVNVIKHGKGNSLTKLHKEQPGRFYEYISIKSGDGPWREHVSPNLIIITPAEFDKFATDLRKFWEEFPSDGFCIKWDVENAKQIQRY